MHTLHDVTLKQYSGMGRRLKVACLSFIFDKKHSRDNSLVIACCIAARSVIVNQVRVKMSSGSGVNAIDDHLVCSVVLRH